MEIKVELNNKEKIKIESEDKSFMNFIINDMNEFERSKLWQKNQEK